jgi:hypothetical protein
MAVNYTPTTVSGIGVPTSANNGNDMATGLLKMANDQDAAFLPGSWTAVSLATGFGAGGTATPGARLEMGSVVRLRGRISNTSGSTVAAFTTIATLPAGMRPSETLYLTTIGNLANSIATLLEIDPSGALTIGVSMTAGQGMSLGGVTFAK